MKILKILGKVKNTSGQLWCPRCHKDTFNGSHCNNCGFED
jgi:ribosomal protein L37E